MGVIATYHMEERERVKIVDYQGSKQIDRTKIEEQLRERGIELRLDSFLDEGVIRRVKTVLRAMMAEKGFTNAEVNHKVTPVAGGPKLVNVTFNVSEGPKIKIREIDFVGNSAIGDGTLQRKLKENKPKGILSFITGGGTYKETEFEADADRIVEYYQNQGYVRARVGQPELKVLENTKDGKTRWVELRIPVTEGPRYRIGELSFAGNTLVKSEQLRPLFKLQPGEWYSRKEVDDGPQEGAGDLRRRRLHGVHRVPGPEAERRARAGGSAGGAGSRRAAGAAGDRPGQAPMRRPSASPCGSRKGRSTSSTASVSPATRPRATT